VRQEYIPATPAERLGIDYVDSALVCMDYRRRRKRLRESDGDASDAGRGQESGEECNESGASFLVVPTPKDRQSAKSDPSQNPLYEHQPGEEQNILLCIVIWQVHGDLVGN
jgi:hypothetical protein